MTYNFDPERWFENQLRVLERRLELGEIEPERHESEIEALNRRLDTMLDRLDGTYQIPHE